jgi:alpha-galactosidase
MDKPALVNRKPSIICMDRRTRRTFLTSSGTAAFGALLPRISRFLPASNTPEPFARKTNDLIFSFDVMAGKLRQKRLVPAGIVAATADNSSGVEIALQCSGENSPDQGMKSGVGQPGSRLLFAGKREESTRGGS